MNGDEDHANPKRHWQEMGEPEYLGVKEVQRLQEASRLVKEPQRWEYHNRALYLTTSLPPHAVAAMTVALE